MAGAACAAVAHCCLVAWLGSQPAVQGAIEMSAAAREEAAAPFAAVPVAGLAALPVPELAPLTIVLALVSDLEEVGAAVVAGGEERGTGETRGVVGTVGTDGG